MRDQRLLNQRCKFVGLTKDGTITNSVANNGPSRLATREHEAKTNFFVKLENFFNWAGWKND